MTPAQPRIIENIVLKLETNLGIAPGFLEGLYQEDDWSFVVKAHAFLEAALSHLLAEAIQEPSTARVFARLETSNRRTGKLAFIQEMDLLDSRARQFIQVFSELRNALLHDVRQVSFRFADHYSSLGRERKKSFIAALSFFATGATFELEGKPHKTDSFVVENLKLSAWFSVMAICAVIYLTRDFHRLRKHVAENGKTESKE